MLHVVVKKAMYLESNNDANNDYNHSNTSKYFHNTLTHSDFFTPVDDRSLSSNW